MKSKKKTKKKSPPKTLRAHSRAKALAKKQKLIDWGKIEELGFEYIEVHSRTGYGDDNSP